MEVDKVLVDITDYVLSEQTFSEIALETARYCLIDSLGCAALAMHYPACTKHLGPLVPGLSLENGAHVPGTSYRLDPVQAAFNIGTLVRWLDYNDTWLAKEWGHPSDNLGAILAVCDYVAQTQSGADITIADVLHAMIQCYEIQGVLSLENSFNQVGLDHVAFVKIASTAVAAKLLGANREQILNAVSNAWVDGQSLRTYRHAPNTGSRKSWAAGDATSRAVRLALMSLTGEMGYPNALTAPKWGVQDVLYRSEPITLNQPLGCYVMENILFKISYPAEFHAQTAVEAALQLYPAVKDKYEAIESIHIETQEPGDRIINKTGALKNPADRDHCLQYMVAIALAYGELTADHYEDKIASEPLVDELRALMTVKEQPTFTETYYDANKRYISNAIQITFHDGTQTERVQVDCPIGHRTRRNEGYPKLLDKFSHNIRGYYQGEQADAIIQSLTDQISSIDTLPISQFMALFVKEH